MTDFEAPSPDDIRGVHEASRAYFNDVKAKHGEAKTIVLSECSNLVILAQALPGIEQCLRPMLNELPEVLAIPRDEVEAVMLQFLAIRHLVGKPPRTSTH